MRLGSRSVDGESLGISLDDLYRLHAAHALRVARSVTANREDAADAVAEAFAGVLRAVSDGRLSDPDSVRPYLLVATRNAAIDIVRRAGRQQSGDPTADLDGTAAPAPGPSDRLLAGEDRDLVARAFATLPARWRAVLWLTEVERLAPREAAPLLGLTPNNVAQLATRARGRLRRQYVQSHVRNHARGDCADATELLGGLVAGQLTPVQAARVRGHLAGCPACRARLAEVEDLGLALRRAALPPAAVVPAAFAGLRGWWHRWWGGLHGPRLSQLPAAIDPAVAAAQVDAAVQVAGSPAAQQVAASVVAGLLVLGVGAAVVHDDAPAPPPTAPAVAPTTTAAFLPAVPLPTTGPIPTTTAPAASTTSTTTTAPAGPPAGAPAQPAAFIPRGPLATAQPSLVAHALGAQLAVFDGPGAPAAAASRVLANPRPSGAPLVLLVLDQQPGWLQVLLPVRPNGSTGWVRSADVSLTATDYRVVVELGAHRITAYQGTAVVLSEPIAVGTTDAPTPGGLYYVTELFQPLDPAGNLDPGGPYGPYAFGLSGYSDVLFDFAGGDGQFGIHGTDEPALLGQDVSHGCIRMSNAGVTRLAAVLPLGVPVQILG